MIKNICPLADPKFLAGQGDLARGGGFVWNRAARRQGLAGRDWQDHPGSRQAVEGWFLTAEQVTWPRQPAARGGGGGGAVLQHPPLFNSFGGKETFRIEQETNRKNNWRVTGFEPATLRHPEPYFTSPANNITQVPHPMGRWHFVSYGRSLWHCWGEAHVQR